MTTQNAEQQSLDTMIDAIAEAAAQRFAMSLRTGLNLALPMGGGDLHRLPTAAVVTAPQAVEPTSPTPRRGRPPKAQGKKPNCTEKDCVRPARSKGLCAAHYQKQLRDAQKAVPVKPGKPPKGKRRAKAKKGTAPTPTA